MPSGFVRDFTNDGQLIWKECSIRLVEPSPLLSPCYPLAIPLLESTFLLASILLPSSYLLSTFFLPSCYLLPTHHFEFTKRIFSTRFITNCQSQIQNFQFSSSKFQYEYTSPYFSCKRRSEPSDFIRTMTAFTKARRSSCPRRISTPISP